MLSTPRIEASGVRNSWEATATNSDLARSTSRSLATSACSSASARERSSAISARSSRCTWWVLRCWAITPRANPAIASSGSRDMRTARETPPLTLRTITYITASPRAEKSVSIRLNRMATAMRAIRYRVQYSLSVPPVATHHRVISVASTSRVAARNLFADMVSYGRARRDQNEYTAARTRTDRARGRTAGRIPVELRYTTATTATTAMRTSAMDRSVRHSSGDSDPCGAPAPEVSDRLIPPPVEKGQIPETGYPKGISDPRLDGLSRSATPRPLPGGVSPR